MQLPQQIGTVADEVPIVNDKYDYEPPSVVRRPTATKSWPMSNQCGTAR